MLHAWVAVRFRKKLISRYIPFNPSEKLTNNMFSDNKSVLRWDRFGSQLSQAPFFVHRKFRAIRSKTVVCSRNGQKDAFWPLVFFGFACLRIKKVSSSNLTSCPLSPRVDTDASLTFWTLCLSDVLVFDNVFVISWWFLILLVLLTIFGPYIMVLKSRDHGEIGLWTCTTVDA